MSYLKNCAESYKEAIFSVISIKCLAERYKESFI